MSMSKKDFIALADAMRDVLRMEEDNGKDSHADNEARQKRNELREQVIKDLTWFCGQQNPMFKYSRWIGYLRGENGPNGGRVSK